MAAIPATRNVAGRGRGRHQGQGVLLRDTHRGGTGMGQGQRLLLRGRGGGEVRGKSRDCCWGAVAVRVRAVRGRAQ